MTLFTGSADVPIRHDGHGSKGPTKILFLLKLEFKEKTFQVKESVFNTNRKQNC